MGRETNPRLQIQLPLLRSHLKCRRCGRWTTAADSMASPTNRFSFICTDVRACHARMMRGKLSVVPGEASY